MSFHQMIAHPRFLHRLMAADALATGATGVLLLSAADLLAPLLNLPVGLQRAAGGICVVFAACVLALSRSSGIPRGAVKAVIAINIAWVVASVWVAFGGHWRPSVFGVCFVMAQALVVLAFVELGWFGLRAAGKRSLPHPV
ncbi:hypothetical protein [Pseudoxanthomonas putridarboris]|uniref:SPW repeat-containing protein n=1 Tax=Pseudoxanthomonas putridarboris TaxID=752605 RepID=A0ABU9IV25_9GAMM